MQLNALGTCQQRRPPCNTIIVLVEEDSQGMCLTVKYILTTCHLLVVDCYIQKIYMKTSYRVLTMDASQVCRVMGFGGPVYFVISLAIAYFLILYSLSQ